MPSNQQPVEEGMVSERAIDWEQFSSKVHDHIENYTVPQYGDKGNDNATDYGVPDFHREIKRYTKRMESNMRPGEAKRDLLKMCHYCQMLYDILPDHV